ncbi:polyadenylate-binding protein 5-like [Camellia sinensis]|uniref:polyadenylate-binding protein 5-like n=1 Tax=Camellia sinensis TaxID=4442 RepID=UPI0010365F49|nr:polyadenylate-binding protein 5-like [Camellia sinensis]
MSAAIAGAGRSGGWQPVLYGKRRLDRREGSRKSGKGIFTIFVDNIPWSMNPKGLFSLFSKFGIVKDVYIPSKTRKSTKTRFGFVRFDCPVAVAVAIQKTNRLWCEDKELYVKRVEFEKARGFEK